MANVPAPESRLSLLWYYLDYLDPRYLVDLYAIVASKFWRGAPQIDHNAVEMDEVDENGEFQKGKEVVHLPVNVPRLPDCEVFAGKIHVPPSLLSNERLLRRLLGDVSNTELTKVALQSLCNKDPNFLNSNIFYAHKKSSALYQLVREAYFNDYHEEPQSIDYHPVHIGIEEKDDSFWIRCTYEGKIVTKKDQSIPFESICSYNLMDPKIAARSLFINHRRESI